MAFNIGGLLSKFKKKKSDDDYDDDYDLDEDDSDEGGGNASAGESGGDDDDVDDDDDFDDDEEGGGGLSAAKKKKFAIIGGAAALVLALAGGGAWWFFGGDGEPDAEMAKSGTNQISLALPGKGQTSGAPGGMTPPGKGAPSLNQMAAGGASLNQMAQKPAGGGASLNQMAAIPAGQAMGAGGLPGQAMTPEAIKAAQLSAAAAVRSGKMPAPSGGAGVVVPSVFANSYANIAKASPGTPLAQAPVKELVEQTKEGVLPIKSQSGQTAMTVYARPFDKNIQGPKVGIIVGGLGLSSAATEAAIKNLPPEVTLAFDAYGRNLAQWIPAARAAGHEVLISLPMEPVNYPISDPGPMALLTTLRPETNLARLNQVLGKGAGYVGLVTVMGSQFSSSENSLRPILLALKDRGVLLVDIMENSNSKIAKVGGEVGLITGRVDVPIDRIPNPVSVDLALSELESVVKQKTVAVGYASPYPVSIDRIVNWAQKLKDKGITLAPISALAPLQNP